MDLKKATTVGLVCRRLLLPPSPCVFSHHQQGRFLGAAPLFPVARWGMAVVVLVLHLQQRREGQQIQQQSIQFGEEFHLFFNVLIRSVVECSNVFIRFNRYVNECLSMLNS